MADEIEEIDGEGFVSRTAAAASMDPRGDGSGLRPFWDYEQESLDASAVKWTVETAVDGSLSTLYVQAPYGYQADLLQADKSVILGKIVDAMRREGHDDWADVVEADKVWTLDWRSGACQSIGYSYKKWKSPDTNKLKAFASYDPYSIHTFNEDLLSKLAPDENPDRGVDKMAMTMGNMFVASTIICTLGALADPSMLYFAVLSAIGSILHYRYGLHVRKKKLKDPLRRPGFLLETTSGWLVWQYDAGYVSTPRRLVDAATTQVKDWISKNYQYDQPTIAEVATSADGRMTWFRSDRKLDSECELSPYQAEQYLSLFVKHQSNREKTRTYPGDEPTVILSTVSEAALTDGATSGLGEPKSAWTADEAVKRAQDRLDSNVPATVDPSDDVALADQSMRLEAMARDLISKAMVKEGPASVDTVRKAGAVLNMLKTASTPEELSKIEADLDAASDVLYEAKSPVEIAAAAGLKAMNASPSVAPDSVETPVAPRSAVTTTDPMDAKTNPFLRGR